MTVSVGKGVVVVANLVKRALRLAVLLSTAGIVLPERAHAQSRSPVTVSEGAVTIGPVVTPTAGMPDYDLLAPRATAVRTDGEIELDGRLDEEAWRSAPVITAFWQREPDEAAPASQRTEVRFAYDDATLFIGARMYDSEGADGVVSQLVRRDGDPQSDMLTR